MVVDYSGTLGPVSFSVIILSSIRSSHVKRREGPDPPAFRVWKPQEPVTLSGKAFLMVMDALV